MSTIIITGSTRGIGLGLATEFLAKGHQVVINGRDKEKVDEVEAQKIHQADKKAKMIAKIEEALALLKANDGDGDDYTLHLQQLSNQLNAELQQPEANLDHPSIS